jgi:3,4-dihydroxy 2-butanone 4-phosphate synthase
MRVPEERLKEAVSALRRGEFVLVFDSEGREGETDLVILSERATPKAIAFMRKNAGGLICTTVDAGIARRLGIPLYTDMIDEVTRKFPSLKGLVPNDVKYDKRSSFSITVNHRGTFTGITDKDRALTISEFGRLCKMANNGCDLAVEFGKRFRTPGHVHLLISDKDLIAGRQGHTELVESLLKMGDLTPSATICEMLGDDGKALPRARAMKFAKEHELVFLDGKEIISAFLHGRGKTVNS